MKAREYLKMTIDRNVFGTVVKIELTEDEIKNAHIAYLDSEMNKVIKPVRKRNYRDGLNECRKEIDNVHGQAYTIGKIIDEYRDDIIAAYRDGVSTNRIGTMIGVSKLTVKRHLERFGVEIRPMMKDIYHMYVVA